MHTRNIIKKIYIHPELGILAWEDVFEITTTFDNTGESQTSTNKVKYRVQSLDSIDLDNGHIARYLFDGDLSDVASGLTSHESTGQVAYVAGKTAFDMAIRSMGGNSELSYFRSLIERAFAVGQSRAFSLWFRSIGYPGNTGGWAKSNLGQFILPTRIIGSLRMLEDNTIGWDTGNGVRFYSMPAGKEIADGEWHHIAVSYNGSILDGQGTIYLNGEKLTGGNLMWETSLLTNLLTVRSLVVGGIRGW